MKKKRENKPKQSVIDGLGELQDHSISASLSGSNQQQEDSIEADVAGQIHKSEVESSTTSTPEKE